MHFGLDHIVHWFNASPEAARMRAEEAAKVAAERAATAEKIAGVRREYERAWPKLERERLAALSEVEAQRKKLASAEEKHALAHTAVVNATATLSRQIGRHESFLRETAAPEIGEFRRWLFAEWERARHRPTDSYGETVPAGYNVHSGQEQRKVVPRSERGTVSSRERFLDFSERAAVARQELDALEVDARADVHAELARIRGEVEALLALVS
jgi:hypothetical protein